LGRRDDADVGDGLPDPLALVLKFVEDAAADDARILVVVLSTGDAAEAQYGEQRQHEQRQPPLRGRTRPQLLPDHHVAAEVTAPATSPWTSPGERSVTCRVTRSSCTVMAHSSVAPAMCTPTSTAGTSLKYWM